MTLSYDLIVIGSGPAGEKAAVKAAYFGYRVAIVEKTEAFGGAGVQTGTLPSKTLKETSVYLSGIYNKGIFSIDRELGRDAGVKDFLYRKDLVVEEAGAAVVENLQRHHVEIYIGRAEFVNEHDVAINNNSNPTIIHGRFILIATGSYPVRPKSIPFDNIRLHDSDSILYIERFPKSLCVLGAGVIGCEYATIFATMGVKTYIVNSSSKILGFLDQEISEALVEQMKASGVTIIVNEEILTYDVPEDEHAPITFTLKGGAEISTDIFLFAAGRSGNTRNLRCENAGVLLGDRETVRVNEKFQTNVAHIYAVGDVTGFPALASTSMDQGRIAVAHMFETRDLESLTDIFPYGIYTVPEVSMVGITEEQALAQGLTYVVGYCYHHDTLRGKIVGARNGFLKLIAERESHVILGVSIIGMLATELIHYGMALIRDKKTLDHVIATVFNFPTLHDLYKYASYDALGNIKGKNIKRPRGRELS